MVTHIDILKFSYGFAKKELSVTVEPKDITIGGYTDDCKTVELTKLMLGDYLVPGTTTKSAKIIVSTVAELEFLIPLFEEYKAEGRDINVSSVPL